MKIEIPDEYKDTFSAAALNGYLNLNWTAPDHVEFSLTDIGSKLLLTALEEATSVPDDPIALQAQVEMWRERALKAEAKVSPAHNHDYDPSCREFVRQGVTLGSCVLREFLPPEKKEVND